MSRRPSSSDGGQSRDGGFARDDNLYRTSSPDRPAKCFGRLAGRPRPPLWRPIAPDRQRNGHACWPAIRQSFLARPAQSPPPPCPGFDLLPHPDMARNFLTPHTALRMDLRREPWRAPFEHRCLSEVMVGPQPSNRVRRPNHRRVVGRRGERFCPPLPRFSPGRVRKCSGLTNECADSLSGGPANAPSFTAAASRA